MALAFRQLRPSRHPTADSLRQNGSSESTTQPYHIGELETLSPPSHDLPRKQRFRDKFRHMISFKDQDDSLDDPARNPKAQHIQQFSKLAPSIPAEPDIDETAPVRISAELDLPVPQRETSPAPNNATITGESNAQFLKEAIDPEPTQGLSSIPTMNVNHAKLVTSFMRIVEDIKLIQIEHSEEFDEPLESEYGRARTGIFEYLCQAQSPLPTGSLQILRGNSKDGSSGKPCIRIIHGDFGDQKKLTNFHLKFSNQRKRYDPPFTICYQTLWDLSSVGNQVAVAWSPSPDSICGLLASAGAGDHRHHFTLGGLLEVEGRLHAVTAWHDGGATVKESTDEPVKELLERMVEAGELRGNLEPPLVAARYHGQSEFEEEHEQFVNADGLEFLKSAGSISLTGSEWALIHVDNDFLKLPNCVRADVEFKPEPAEAIPDTPMHPPQRALRYLTHAHPAGDVARTSTVLVLAGVSGEIKATISRKLSAMRLDSGKVVQVWTLSFAGSKGMGLQKGDSGSWVVQPESGIIFGHVIAGTYRNAFVLPLDTVMGEIGDCVLPTPFTCLAELARAYNNDGNAELAEQFAMKAVEENVLLISSKASELAHLIETRGRLPFVQSQSYSSLEPNGIFQYIIARGGSKIPNTSEIISWLTSEETPFWYLALKDIQELLHDLGLNPDFEPKPADKASSWRGPNAGGHPFLTFTCIKSSWRNRYLNGLTKSERAEIGRELEWIESVRHSIIDGSKSNVDDDDEDDVRVSVTKWRIDVAQRNRIQQGVQGRHHISQRSEFPKGKRQGEYATKPRSSGDAFDVKGRIMEFRPSAVTTAGGHPTEYAEFSCMKGVRTSDLKGPLAYVHLPANNVEWMDRVVKTLDANIRDDGRYWQNLQQGPVFSRHMRPICASVSSRSSFPDLVLCLPYLRCEKDSRRRSIASCVMIEHQRHLHALGQDGHGTTPSDQQPAPLSWQKRRHFRPTKLGKLLLKAAALYEAMSLHTEKRMIQTTLFGSDTLHLRRTLHQAYGVPQVDVDNSTFPSNCNLRDDKTSAVMVDQLWMRIIDGKIVVTSFPDHFGRDLADPFSIYQCIGQRLKADAMTIDIKPYDMALVIIEECISCFFKRPQTAGVGPTNSPCGISRFAEEISSMASKSAYFGKRHRLFLLSETPIPPAALLELFDAQHYIESILYDLSMIEQLLSEQDSVIEDFIGAAESQPRRFPTDDGFEKFGTAEAFRSRASPRDNPKSRYRIETQLLKSRIQSQMREVSSMKDTLNSIHRTILSLSGIPVPIDRASDLGKTSMRGVYKSKVLPR